MNKCKCQKAEWNFITRVGLKYLTGINKMLVLKCEMRELAACSFVMPRGCIGSQNIIKLRSAFSACISSHTSGERENSRVTVNSVRILCDPRAKYEQNSANSYKQRKEQVDYLTQFYGNFYNCIPRD